MRQGLLIVSRTFAQAEAVSAEALDKTPGEITQIHIQVHFAEISETHIMLSLRLALVYGLFAACTLAVPPQSGCADGLVANWDFNNGLTLGETGGYSYGADLGAGTLTVDPGWQIDNDGNNRGITALAGTQINGYKGTAAAGLSLTLQGGIGENNATQSPAQIPNNNRYMQVQVDLTNYLDPVLSLATYRSLDSLGHGFDSNQVSWSLDGSTFFDLGSAFDPTEGNWTVQSFDLSGMDQLDGAATVYFRMTFNGATSNGGHNRIDNIILLATSVIPEPSTATFALSLLGIATVAGTRRRQRAFRNQNQR